MKQRQDSQKLNYLSKNYFRNQSSKCWVISSPSLVRQYHSTAKTSLSCWKGKKIRDRKKINEGTNCYKYKTKSQHNHVIAQKCCSLTAGVELVMKNSTYILKEQHHQLQFHYRKQELKTELRHERPTVWYFCYFHIVSSETYRKTKLSPFFFTSHQRLKTTQVISSPPRSPRSHEMTLDNSATAKCDQIHPASFAELRLQEMQPAHKEMAFSLFLMVKLVTPLASS